MSMKAVREIVVTREEAKVINNFLEVCEKFDIAESDILALLGIIADEEETSFWGIDIVIRG